VPRSTPRIFWSNWTNPTIPIPNRKEAREAGFARLLLIWTAPTVPQAPEQADRVKENLTGKKCLTAQDKRMTCISSTSPLNSDQFIPVELRGFLETLERAPSTDAVWDALVALAQTLHLPVVHYEQAADFHNWAQAHFVRTTLDNRWVHSLVRQTGTRPLLSTRSAGSPGRLTPWGLGPAYAASPARFQADAPLPHRLAAELGLRAGLAIPLQGGQAGDDAVIIFGGPHTRSAFDLLMSRHGWALHAAAMSAHAHHSRLFRAEFVQRNHLTDKQRELLRMVGTGMMDKQIAHDLGISFSAVRQRLAAVQQKTGAQNRAHLAALAMRAGLVSDPMLMEGGETRTICLCPGESGDETVISAAPDSMTTAAQ
jgi:DNA-binding CsgD family transcriptional regulator